MTDTLFRNSIFKNDKYSGAKLEK